MAEIMDAGPDGPAGEFWTQSEPSAVMFHSDAEGLTVYWVNGMWFEVDRHGRMLPGMLHVGECQTRDEAIAAGWAWLNEAEREASESYGN